MQTQLTITQHNCLRYLELPGIVGPVKCQAQQTGADYSLHSRAQPSTTAHFLGNCHQVQASPTAVRPSRLQLSSVDCSPAPLPTSLATATRYRRACG